MPAIRKWPSNWLLPGKREETRLKQLNAAIEKLPVGNSKFLPAFQHFFDSKTFLASELLIPEIRVVNDLPDHFDLFSTDTERFLQGLESAVLAAVSKPDLKH